eukprot:UN01439
MPSRCGLCSKTGAARLCSGCKITNYCSVQCQRKHWKQHKKICKSLANKQPKPMKSSKKSSIAIKSIAMKSSNDKQDSSSSPIPTTLPKLSKSRKSIELKEPFEQFEKEQKLEMTEKRTLILNGV